MEVTFQEEHVLSLENKIAAVAMETSIKIEPVWCANDAVDEFPKCKQRQRNLDLLWLISKVCNITKMSLVIDLLLRMWRNYALSSQKTLLYVMEKKLGVFPAIEYFRNPTP